VVLNGSERTQAVLFNSPDAVPENLEKRPAKRPVPGPGAVVYATILGIFWTGAAVAFLLGYFGPAALAQLASPLLVLIGFATLMPPLLLIAGAWAISRGRAMASAAVGLAEATDRLLSADETAARTAARLGRMVRRELDALNGGLDNAYTRLRALESVLENQISALDEAGARADVRAEAAASRLSNERERLDALAGTLSDTAARASELVAGRSALLKSNMETAEITLRAAGLALDAQVSTFRTAVEAAGDAPHTVAVELERQSKSIEQVSDAAMSRAEFVLGRHERHRGAMTELLQRLKDESATFEAGLGAQRTALESAIAVVNAQSQSFEALFVDADRKLEFMMANSASRTAQLATGVGREIERMNEFSEGAMASLARVSESLHTAGVSAQTLIGETASEAQTKAKALVGDAMAECEKLLRVAGELSAESRQIKETLSSAVNEMQGHLLALPGVAKQEAQRVRDLVRSETEEILDLSARTLSTIQARTTTRPVINQQPSAEIVAAEPASEGLRGFARRLTRTGKRKDDPKAWEMSTLLAAAENSEPHDFKPEAAAALGALQAVLADLAIDLGAIAPEQEAGEDEWRRYLAGDRSVFARRLARTIDETAVERITALYRDNVRFHDSVDAYIVEFETLLTRARAGDGGGLLASTILTADTGKIYLTLAYALGRL
jgi:hypothetical protein